MLVIDSTVHSTHLGQWTSHQCKPGSLAPGIETIWEVHGTVIHTRERVFPSARVDVVINLGPPQRLVDGRRSRPIDRGSVSGFQHRPLVIESAVETHVFGVRLRSEGAGRLLGVPAHEIAGRVEALSDVAGRRGAALESRICAAASFDERAAIVCRWAEDERSASGLRSYVWHVAAAIEAAGGASPIDELRRSAAVSRKKLVADFREHVGVPPKLLARIVRFRRAAALLQQRGCSLADAALAAGYFDQSHMSSDFREFAATSPGEFAAACYPDGLSAAVV